MLTNSLVNINQYIGNLKFSGGGGWSFASIGQAFYELFWLKYKLFMGNCKFSDETLRKPDGVKQYFFSTIPSPGEQIQAENRQGDNIREQGSSERASSSGVSFRGFH